MHEKHIPRVIPCSVQLVARPNHAQNVIQPLSGIHDFVCSVHLDARMNHSQNVIHHLSGIHDFVQQVARYGTIPPRCVIDDFVQQVARYEGIHWCSLF